MALQSPGVQVTVIDESFYTPAEPGTTPLIVIATAENKSNAAGTGTAAGTTQANAGKVFKITSQRELVDTYGVPFFEKTASSSPIHGGERNEYGLLAAYSFLGVSNSAFIVRADVNLDELEGQTTAPGAEPIDGAWWVDTLATSWGIQEWNGAGADTTGGQKFSLKTPIVLTDNDESKVSSNAPRSSVGSIGDYAIVFQTVLGTGTFSAARELATLWFKSAGGTYASGAQVVAGDWVLVGSPEWKASWPTISSTTTTAFVSGGNIVLNGNTISVAPGASRATVATAISTLGATQGISAKAVGGFIQIYSDGEDSSTSDSTAITKGILQISGTGDVLTALGITAGDYYPPSLQQTPHTVVPTWKATGATPRPSGSVWIKTTEPNYGARWIVKRWNSATKAWVEYTASIYATTEAALYYLDRSGGGQNIATGSIFVQSNSDQEVGQDATAKFRVWKKKASGATVITSSIIEDLTLPAASYTFSIAESLAGELALSNDVTISFTAIAGSGSGITDANLIASRINAAGLTHVVAEVTANNELQITHRVGGDIHFTDGTGTPLADIFTAFNISSNEGTVNFYSLADLAPADPHDYIATNWTPLAADELRFNATSTTPLAEPQDGQLWYNPAFDQVDIMVHNGKIWVGYRTATSPYWNADAAQRTDVNGPIVAASMPTLQSDGTPLRNGDLWISTADLENFPTIYRFNTDGGTTTAEKWQLVDKTDQTTEEGILFADARYGISGATGTTAATIKELLASNYVDFDCPDPSLYPKGMMLWNLRRSGGNVKRYANGYIDTAAKNSRYQAQFSDAGDSPVLGDGQSLYATDRWVTASPNNEDGSGSFGRKAQRALVVQKLKSVIDTSSEARDEERRNFNLIACPGYPETYSNLINLNLDRGMTAFVLGDSPLRLPSDATSLTAWGTNANGALDNGDTGIVSYDEYSAVWYPNGFTTDLGGANAVVPATHMMLRTIALSDQVSYPWFAPAGTRRGGITNATAVGYIDAATGEFQSVALNEGQRDTLYDLKVNPIPFFVGVGLVAYGQKTRARNASALDRINVARLTVYLRSQLTKLARPYIFEPNDKITRDEVKGAVESLLIELVGLRALYDFAVVCDESNNTNARIDRNELWVDIAIEPVKAVEFIYIPLRIKNTGEI
jgi:hypothetical protein